MFDFVHERKRLVQIVLALIILPFAFWGLDSYQRSGEMEAPATVNDVKVSAQELDEAMRNQQNQFRQMFGENFDSEMFDTPEMKRAVLDRLVEARLLVQSAQSAGLRIGDDDLARIISGVDAFKVNGVFDKQRYEEALASKDLSPAMFEMRLRDDLLGQQVQQDFLQNGYASRAVAENVLRLNEQLRTVAIVELSPQAFMAKTTVDASEVSSYYDSHKKDFELPEKVRAEYVVLSAAELQARQSISAAEIRQYYEAHESEYGIPEQRQAAHILIAITSTAPQTEQDAARKQATDLLRQIKQNPGKFAELAKKHSQDTGSAANGGALDSFGRGMMVKPFEDAVFSMKTGEISEPIKTDFGYHIIKLLAIKSSEALPLEIVRGDIETKLRQQKANDAFAELAENFSNTAYEQSDTLEPAAKLADLKIQQSDWINKGSVPGGIWNAKLLAAIFSEDAVKNQRNTAAIEVAPNMLVAARVLAHQPASVRPLGQVEADILVRLKKMQASDLAIKQGEKMLAEFQAGRVSQATWSQALTISRNRIQPLDEALARKVFQADVASSSPVYLGGKVEGRGYLLVRVDKVTDVSGVEDANLTRYQQQLRRVVGEELFRAFLEDAKANAEIKINVTAETTAQ
ncbi:MAG: SurA N-terminal domain-containing protein [Gallionella sp.]|jgi:peptidyl-prolyl cis-trans isomerase D|nr:SurA N-terminal domain-containing protein [Gallionella sp.]